MNYNTNYKIKNVNVLDTFNDFQNLISKVEIDCEINIPELNKFIQLPLVSLLSIPNNNENYISFDDITKEKIIEWVLKDNQYKIDMIVNRTLEIEKIKKQSVMNNQQKITTKTFTENDLGKLEFLSEKNISDQIFEESVE
jgi:hypothetical protein